MAHELGLNHGMSHSHGSGDLMRPSKWQGKKGKKKQRGKKEKEKGVNICNPDIFPHPTHKMTNVKV